MSAHQVNGQNNFCRVFELPEKFSSEYCTGGGIPTNFNMVDWFYPVTDMHQMARSKGMRKQSPRHLSSKKIDLKELEETLIPFIQRKNYIRQGRTYLVIYDFGASTVFSC